MEAHAPPESTSETTPSPRRFHILVCDGPSCGVTHESDVLVECIGKRLSAGGLTDRVTVGRYTCYGRCEDGPNMFVWELQAGEEPSEDPDDDVLCERRGFYPGMDPDKIARVVDGHCAGGEVVEDLVDDY